MKQKPLRSLRKRLKAGALFWVTTMLLTSAVLRLGLEIGPAIALETETSPAAVAEPAGSADMRVVTPDDLKQLMSELEVREAAVESRERQIEERLKALQTADAAIEEKLTAMAEAEAALTETLAIAKSASENDLAALTSVYEKMKPKEAAPLFEAMDPVFAAGFLARMRPEVAAGIMAKLSPDAAYSISVILAGRNANVPRE